MYLLCAVFIKLHLKLIKSFGNCWAFKSIILFINFEFQVEITFYVYQTLYKQSDPFL